MFIGQLTHTSASFIVPPSSLGHAILGQCAAGWCVYETTNRNGSAIVGGYPTRSEMCLVAIYYYNRVPGYGDCRSETRTERYAKFIGIRNTTFDSIRREAVITEPEIYSSLSVETFANDVIDWDLGTRAELQRLHLYQPQISTCRNYIPRDITRTATNRARVARQAIYEPTPLTLAAVPFTPTPRAFVPTSNPFVPPPKNWKPMYTPKPWVRKPKLKQKVEKVINGLQGILDNFLEKTADKNLGGFKRQKNYSPIYTPSPPLYTPLHPIYTRSTPIFISSTTTTSTTTTSTTSTTTSTTTTSTTTTTTPPPPTTVAPPPLTEFEEDNIEHVSVLPRDIPRYQRPSDCKRKRWER
ncbi:hypothetical protein Ocin01_18300 [Orchesella cincta]|uniref:Copper type II ascorbate-dependent monooxygenase C-terminal domain-containing protein n=1 Tax=Orchesella cincta TaxID=48709 RepID=A0A1D2M639_ORCCI|nr:hypothetical protein Ocin01_18300 [Orchesella cincta]